jgi:hypothetical protein
LPRRPDRVDVRAGRLTVSAAASPPGSGLLAEWALLAGVTVADFDLTLQAGRRGVAGAALVLGWRSEADYAFVVVEPGQPVELRVVAAPQLGQVLPSAVPGCRGQTLADAELPDGGALAPLALSWRGGRLTVRGARPLLDCRPPPSLGRGAVGVGARYGSASFAALALGR